MPVLCLSVCCLRGRATCTSLPCTGCPARCHLHWPWWISSASMVSCPCARPAGRALPELTVDATSRRRVVPVPQQQQVPVRPCCTSAPGQTGIWGGPDSRGVQAVRHTALDPSPGPACGEALPPPLPAGGRCLPGVGTATAQLPAVLQALRISHNQLQVRRMLPASRPACLLRGPSMQTAAGAAGRCRLSADLPLCKRSLCCVQRAHDVPPDKQRLPTWRGTAILPSPTPLCVRRTSLDPSAQRPSNRALCRSAWKSWT